MHQGLASTRILVLTTLTTMMVLLGLSFTTPAGAATTSWEAVDVTSAPFVDTMADGTVVTITFGPAAGFWGGTYPPAMYKTDASGPISNSTVRFTFDRPVTSLRTYYAFVGWGDQQAFTTNLGPVNLAQTVAQGGNLVSSTGNFVPGQPEGTYSADGIVSATSTAYMSDANSAILELSFPTGITYLEVRGAPDATLQPSGLAGVNLTGLSLPMTSYEVTFDANGGTGSMADQTASSATALTTNTFTRDGYTFAGWSTTQTGTVEYADGATYPFTASTTFFAQWTAVTPTSFTVTFNANGGSGVMADQTIYTAAQLVPNTFTRQGFEFTGWNTQANGKGTFYANEADIPAADITLFAQWRSTELAKTGFDALTAVLVFLGVFGLGTSLLVFSRIAPRAERALERLTLRQ
jgi:uncharacterized repeat protein (TIGR02543 family)